MKTRNQYLDLKWCMSQWIVLVIFFIFRHSESACYVSNCDPISYCKGNTCYGCSYGYYLQSGSCVKCEQSIPNCYSCSRSTYCTECYGGYYLESELSCVKCPVRCSTCRDPTLCSHCADTYWDVYNKCDSHCSSYCLNGRCDGFTGNCHSCIPGKYGRHCDQDCNLCKDGQCDLRKCTNGCKDGYYMYQLSCTTREYSYCYRCENDNCLTCSNGTYCTQCEQGYYRNYYRHTSGRGYINCLQCNDSCMNCSSTDHCHEDCIKHCSESLNPGTTKSINETMQKLLTFGRGLVTGIGVAIVLFGAGFGIALFIRRQKKEHKYADENSEGNHEYVKTNMTDVLSLISSENNEINNDIHTVSSDTNTKVTNIDSIRDNVMLGNRTTHDSDYTDLQNT